MEHIHTETYKSEKGWKETTEYREYLLDRESGDVTLVVSENCDNPYPGKESYENRETERRILKPEEIPPVVREKIKIIMKNG